MQAPIPAGGLGSGSNYFFADNSSKNIFGLTIQVVINEDLATAAPTGANQNKEAGFSFQLNCHSPIDSTNPSNSQWIVWQQYMVMVRSEVDAWVNNWTAAGLNGSGITIAPNTTTFSKLTKPNVLPAGSTLTIELQYDSSGVSAATFNLQPGGTLTTVSLIGQPLQGGGSVTTANVAPIVAFTLLLVGPEDSQHAHFISGAGSIFYSVTGNYNLLTPLATLPTSVASYATTAETANSTYSQLPVGPQTIYQQDFQVNANTW